MLKIEDDERGKHIEIFTDDDFEVLGVELKTKRPGRSTSPSLMKCRRKSSEFDSSVKYDLSIGLSDSEESDLPAGLEINDSTIPSVEINCKENLTEENCHLVPIDDSSRLARQFEESRPEESRLKEPRSEEYHREEPLPEESRREESLPEESRPAPEQSAKSAGKRPWLAIAVVAALVLLVLNLVVMFLILIKL